MRARRHQRLRQQLVLAGGGHTHVLLLRRWIMRPSLRPADTAVVLVNRASTALLRHGACGGGWASRSRQLRD
jgi:NADH dehydrogenase FAD-containing subunit